jgi:hypothetical protein
MGKHDKLLRKVLDGSADASIRLDDLRALLRRLGFEERIRGSHHLFRHPDLDVFVNLQGVRGKAKPYQVKQVRVAIIKLEQGE